MREVIYIQLSAIDNIIAAMQSWLVT